MDQYRLIMATVVRGVTKVTVVETVKSNSSSTPWWHLTRGTFTTQSSNSWLHGNRAAAKEFNISESIVQKWWKQHDD